MKEEKLIKMLARINRGLNDDTKQSMEQALEETKDALIEEYSASINTPPIGWGDFIVYWSIATNSFALLFVWASKGYIPETFMLTTWGTYLIWAIREHIKNKKL